jgi:hypothetical protein
MRVRMCWTLVDVESQGDHTLVVIVHPHLAGVSGAEGEDTLVAFERKRRQCIALRRARSRRRFRCSCVVGQETLTRLGRTRR